MKGKILIVIVALALGGVAAFATYGYLGSLQRQAEAGSAMTEVYVAKQDIPRGITAEELVSQGLVERISMPLRYVAAGAISSVRGVTDQVLAVPVSKGEVLTTGRFQYPSAAGLAFTVPKDFVAVTVPVDSARGMTGLLRPGDRVAVVVTVPTKGGTDNRTRIAFPGLRVLAIGRSTGVEATSQPTVDSGAFATQQANDTAANTVTLAVSPADAEKLVFAVETGKIWMALLPATASAAQPGPGQTASTVLR